MHLGIFMTFHNGVCDMPFAMTLFKKFQASSQEAEMIPQDLSHATDHKYSLGAA